MVGPSIGERRRDRLNARLRATVVLLVAVSGASVAVQAGGSPVAVLGGGLVGGVVGYAAVRYLAVLGRQARASERTGAGRERSFGTDEEDPEDERKRDERRPRPRQ